MAPDAGVVAIIGHMTSAQSIAGRQVTEKAGTVLLSPTTSTSELAGLQDHFFRLTPPNMQEAGMLAPRVYQERGLSSVAAIYDTDNAAFTQTLWAAFAQVYQDLGGQIAGQASFSSTGTPDLDKLVAELEALSPEALL